MKPGHILLLAVGLYIAYMVLAKKAQVKTLAEAPGVDLGALGGTQRSYNSYYTSDGYFVES